MAKRKRKQQLPPQKLIGFTEAIRNRYAKMTVAERVKFWKWVDEKRRLKACESKLSPRERHELRQQLKQRLDDMLRAKTSIVQTVAYEDHIRWQHFRSI